MRTTLDIGEDVLEATKRIARDEGTTAGKVITNIVRAALRGETGKKTTKSYIFKNGIPVLPPREGPLITNEHIDRLRNEEGI